MLVLNAMDAQFLSEQQCWFGEGTRIVLELDGARINELPVSVLDWRSCLAGGAQPHCYWSFPTACR